MANTHTFSFSCHLAAAIATTLNLLASTPAFAGAAHGRLLVSVTVIDACNINLNTSIQLVQSPQFNRLRDLNKASSCEGQRPYPGNSQQAPSNAATDSTRGLYNTTVDETAGQMTLIF
jgi:hypothetical protein